MSAQTIPINPKDLKLNYQETPNPGVGVIVASHEITVCPIGHLWFSEVLVNLVPIHNIYVHEDFRREGVATAMLRCLRQAYPQKTICTAVGNDLSTPWLLKNGFTKEEFGWFLRRPQPCPMI